MYQKKNENTFGLVLNEIAKSVLCTLNKSEREKAHPESESIKHSFRLAITA